MTEYKIGNVNQKVSAHIAFGNAGLSSKDRLEGYLVHLCTMDEENRFVDLMLKKEHIQEIYDLIIAWFPEVQSSTPKVIK